MKLEYTDRELCRAEFTDRNGKSCSIQESSIATEAAIWLGCNGPNAEFIVEGKGWVEYPLPDNVHCATRMHLTIPQVKALLPLLQHFADTGRLPQ